MHWLWFILIGAIAGWLAGLIMKGRGFGILGNIIVGIIGALIGGWLFDALNIYAGSGMLGRLVTALIGSLVLIFIAGIVNRR